MSHLMRVVLRNSKEAFVRDTQPTGKFSLIGYVADDPHCPELWTDCGDYVGPDTEHAMDIIGYFLPDGRLILIRGQGEKHLTAATHKPTHGGLPTKGRG